MKNKKSFVLLIGFASLFAGSTALSNGLYLNGNSGNSNYISNNKEVSASQPTIDKVIVSEITNSSAIVHWNLSVPEFEDTVFDVTMIDQDNGRTIKVLDRNIEDLGNGSYTGMQQINNLTSDTSYNWKLSVNWNLNDGEETGNVTSDFQFKTVRDPYDAPNISLKDGEEIEIFSDHAIINWDISDPNNLINDLKVVNETTGEVIDITDYISIGSYEIRNLTASTSYTFHLEANWSDKDFLYDNGKIVSNSINFTTLDTTWQEPIINSFSIDESWTTDSSIPIEWNISDDVGSITNIKVVDENGAIIEDLGKELTGSMIIEGLESSTSYNLKLVVNYENRLHGDIGKIESEFINFETFSPWELPAISTFEITNITDTSALITWDVDGMATDVFLYNNNSEYLDLGAVSGEMEIDLDPDTPYNFNLVTEWNNGGNVFYYTSEKTISFTTPEYIAPTVDSFNINVIDDTSVNANWTVIDVNSNVYKIKIIDSKTNKKIVDLGNTLSGTQTITDLTPNTTYNWKLAVDYFLEDGTSYRTAYSEEVEFTTNETIEFVEPTIDAFTIDPSDTSANINWSVSDDSGAITDIKVVDESGNLVNDLGTTLSGTQTITDLTSNTEYKWKLVVEYLDGTGSASSIESELIDFWTDEITFINPIINNFSVTSPTNNSANINWSVTDESGAITDIKVVDESGNLVNDLGTTLSGTQTITDLTSNTEYKWKLVVEYLDGTGSASSIESELIDFWTIRDQYAAPTIEEFNVESKSVGSATIGWIINDPNHIVSHVKVVNDNNELVKDLGTNLTGQVDVTDLTPGSQYNWKLVVEWDDELYSDEVAIESDFVKFSAMNKEEKNDDNSNFVIILTLVIVLSIIIIGGGILIAVSNKK